MTLLNSQPLQGYKHGDFVKFKYNTIVYHNEKGLPMFRDVEQYGWLNNPNILNGKVSITPVGSVHHSDHLRVEAVKVMSKHTHDRDRDYGKTAPEGFQVERPVFDVPKGTPTYAGGDIPIRESEEGSFAERIIPFNEKFDKKTRGKTTALDAEIEKQKQMVNGKVIG
jgi:hypothetical protein